MKKTETSKLIESYNLIRDEIDSNGTGHSKSDSDERFESVAESLVSHSPIELIAAATNDLFCEGSHSYLSAVAVALLSSRDHNKELMRLCEIIGSAQNLYNQVVAYFDKPRRASRIKMNNVLIESIDRLAQINSFDLDKLSSPHWDTYAKIFFNAKLKQSEDVSEVVCTMEMIELCACFRFMGEYGHDIYVGEHIESEDYYPLCILDTENREDVRGLYDLLAKIKGPLIAQKDIDKSSSSNHKFLTLSDLYPITGEDIVSFVENGLFSDIDCYKRLIELTVSASRDEGRLAEIDAAKPKAIKKLLNMGIINPDDFDLMPNTMQRNIRLKLSSDLCL